MEKVFDLQPGGLKDGGQATLNEDESNKLTKISSSKGKKNNSYTKNGLEMLETQAKISWDIWNK